MRLEDIWKNACRLHCLCCSNQKRRMKRCIPKDPAVEAHLPVKKMIVRLYARPLSIDVSLSSPLFLVLLTLSSATWVGRGANLSPFSLHCYLIIRAFLATLREQIIRPKMFLSYLQQEVMRSFNEYSNGRTSFKLT